MDMSGQKKTIGIGDDVPLAPMEALAWIEATGPAGLRCRSGLAVDDGSCWLWLKAQFLSRPPH
jgi:hypothetical protein